MFRAMRMRRIVGGLALAAAAGLAGAWVRRERRAAAPALPSPPEPASAPPEPAPPDTPPTPLGEELRRAERAGPVDIVTVVDDLLDAP
jgi:hypothetical protein